MLLHEVVDVIAAPHSFECELLILACDGLAVEGQAHLVLLGFLLVHEAGGDFFLLGKVAYQSFLLKILLIIIIIILMNLYPTTRSQSMTLVSFPYTTPQNSPSSFFSIEHSIEMSFLTQPHKTARHPSPPETVSPSLSSLPRVGHSSSRLVPSTETEIQPSRYPPV
jgi:hypothetical protein